MTSPTLIMVTGIEGEVPLAHWTWRDSRGNEWVPGDMTTRHLFFTVRAVWNSVLDPDMRVGQDGPNPSAHVFNFKRPVAYLRAAVAILGQELICRPDLEEWQKRELMHMVAHFIKNGWMEVPESQKSLPRFPLYVFPPEQMEEDYHGQWRD